MLADFWDNEEELGVIEKNKTEKIFVKRVVLKGKNYIDMRVFYPNKAGEMSPGKGLTLAEDKLPELLGILNGGVK